MGRSASRSTVAASGNDLRDELRERGERIVERKRNTRIDGEDTDLLVVTDRAAYVVEVKIKPRLRDVGGLLVKADVVARHYPGKKVIPVLAGALIGRDVEEYAVRKGVKVYAY